MGRREVAILLRDAARPTWRAVLAADDEFIIVGADATLLQLVGGRHGGSFFGSF